MSRYFIVLACIAVALGVASAEPRFARVHTKVAWSNCQNDDNIIECINGVIMASDCALCVCGDLA